ncbi:major facilitator superfamily domain-containing protein [Mycena floridula]|nr:major facilitator superfamily domain-containing protein [Mycena floridula]
MSETNLHEPRLPSTDHRLPSTDYRRQSCDDLLSSSNEDIADESELPPSDSFLGEIHDPAVRAPPQVVPLSPEALRRRASFIRFVALLCACSLSVGSHYGSYVLGPLKSRLSRELGASHTEFSLLISAFSLNSTWTPLVAGILASFMGTTFTSILATGIILLGQVLILLGDIWGNIRVMALGMFIFGLGVSPLAVVQETIIVRFFKSHGLGFSMALGLLAGKGASFISARTSYPLTERFGTRAPFYVAIFLATASVVVNLIYIMASRWLIDGAGAELEASDIKEEAQRRSGIDMSEAQALERVAEKRRVNFRDITKLGDVFWAYVGLNVFCGTLWSPFTHLAANIIETRYGLSERDAANASSYLLAGSLILYPICGFLVDRFRHRPIVVHLMLLSSLSTLFSFFWLVLPPNWTHTPRVAIASFATGHGFGPLLLVVLVPKIVPLKYVSTALGCHKSLEQTGSTIFQTLAGLALDQGKDSKHIQSALQHLLNIFLMLNFAQLLTIIFLTYLQKVKDRRANSRRSTSRHEQEPLLSQAGPLRRYSSTVDPRTRLSDNETRETRRGEFFVASSLLLIISAWILFLATAWYRLKKH